MDAEHPHARRRRLLARAPLSVAVVLMLAAVLFVVSARDARDPATRRPQNLSELVQAQSSKVEQLTNQVNDLGAQVQRLTDQADTQAAQSAGSVPLGFAVESGATPVSGPGLVVRLDDAPAQGAPSDVSPDVLVVHQQDLQAVMNALWAGGAEAMELMDQRVVSTSAVRCVGNVLRLHGRVYSPPYVVRAIGNADDMRAALAASPAVRAYERDAQRVGLGWEVASSGTLQLPAYAATQLDYASVPDGVDVLPGLAGSAG